MTGASDMSQGQVDLSGVTVVIPTTPDRTMSLRATLQSLATQRVSTPWEVIVAVNGPEEHSPKSMPDLPVPVRLVHEPIASAARARNLGAKHARGNVLVFLDDDIRPDPETLEALWRAVHSSVESCVLGAVRLTPNQRATPFGRYFSALMDVSDGPEVEEVSWFSSNVVGVRTEDYWRVGGYDEQFPGASLEDDAMAARARACGIRILLCRRVTAVHDDPGRASLRHFSERQRRYAELVPTFARLYPGDNRYELMLKYSSPVTFGDSIHLMVRKAVRRTVASGAAQSALIRVVERLEGLPGRRLWRRAYRVVLAGAITKGVRTGLITQPRLPQSLWGGP